jgi:uncharacterized protein
VIEHSAAMTDEIWVLTDGRAGHINQTLGLAEALTPSPVVKKIGLKAPYRQLSPFLGWGDGRALTADSATIAPPWPRLIVTSGRSAIPIALAIKRKTGGRTTVVNVQDPGWPRSRFDLIVAPEHDRLTGPNVMSTAGALGRTTAAQFAAAGEAFGPSLAHLPHPRVAVLIGGANAVFRTPRAVSERIGRQLAELAAQGAGLMITFSRRTGAEMESIVRNALAGSVADIWSGDGPNPYFAYLALSDVILATEDSASMVSEAATTGKPIHILPLEGGSPKFTRFHGAMRARGIARPYAGAIEQWTYPPFDETGRVAAAVRRLVGMNNATL